MPANGRARGVLPPGGESRRTRACFSAKLRLERRKVDGFEEAVPVMVGHAALWDSLSEPIFDFVEVVRRGAFKKTLKTADVRALFNHNADKLLGRSSSETLALHEDEEGLAIEALLPATTYGGDLVVLLERRDVREMSFTFRAITERWPKERTDDGYQLRELLEVELFDVSPVTFAAYPETDVGIDYRALERAVEAVRSGSLTDQDREMLGRFVKELEGRAGGPEQELHPAEATESEAESLEAPAEGRDADLRRRVAIAMALAR